MPSHYLNQCWCIVNWNLRNKLKWNFNQNTILFIHENAYLKQRLRNGGHFVQEEISHDKIISVSSPRRNLCMATARLRPNCHNYSDVIMSAMTSQITSFSIVCWTICSDTDQRKHQSSASLAFVRGIHQWPVNSPHRGPVTRKMFPFDDVIMTQFHNHNNPRWKHLDDRKNIHIISTHWTVT